MADISKRERIMAHLQGAVRPAARCRRRALHVEHWLPAAHQPIEVGMGDTIGLFDVSRVKNQEMQHMRCDLTVVVEFYCALMIGDDPATELNKMLLDVQRTIRADIYCSGLTLNIVESKNELDIDGPTDNLVAGVVEFSVLYRHLVDDPAT
jgi:hypothetical protein